MADTNRQGQADGTTGRPSALPPILKVYAYDYDPTGRSTANKIVREAHTITPQNRSRYNVIIPAYAPFFRRSLEVVDKQSGQLLIEGIDYTVEWRVVAAADRAENLQPIYGGIQFIDQEITGTFLVTYQTIGGQFTIGSVEIAQALANQANDPLTTNYDDIIGRPLVFPPLEHVHSIKDFVGFDHVKEELAGIKEAIKLLAKEDRDSHPGYDTLIEEYFRLADLLNQLTEAQRQFQREMSDKLEMTRNDLNRKLEEAKVALNKSLNQLSDNLNEKIKVLTNTLNDRIQKLSDQLNNDFNAYKQKTDARLATMDKTIADNQKDLEAKLNQAKIDLNNALTQAKNDLNQRFTNFQTTVNQSLQDQLAKINANKAKNDSQDQEIAGLKTKLAENGGPVTLRGDQIIDGVKRFKKTINFENENTAGKLGRLGYNNGQGVYLYNADSNMFLQLKNDGKLMYNNVEIPNINIMNTKFEEAKNAGADWNTNLRNIPSTLVYNNKQYITVNAPNGAAFAGFDINTAGRRYAFEVESNDGRFKLYRSSGGGQVYFPKESGDQEVAYRAWVNQQLKNVWDAVNLNTNFRNSFSFEF